jgi:hypothetical protein
MPPQRIPLAELMANRPYGPEYSPYTRGKIAGLYIAGLTQRKIIDLTNVSRQGVRGSIALEILNTNGASLPCPGRLIIYYPRDKRIMLRTLRFQPKLTFDQRRTITGIDMSNTYIKNLIRENRILY